VDKGFDALLFSGTALIGGAENYSIGCYKSPVAGHKYRDVYSVSGTIGQHDAGGPLVVALFLTGGFWSLYTVPTPGAPL